LLIVHEIEIVLAVFSRLFRLSLDLRDNILYFIGRVKRPISSMYVGRLSYQINGSDDLVLLIALYLIYVERVVLHGLKWVQVVFDTTWVLSIALVD